MEYFKLLTQAIIERYQKAMAYHKQKIFPLFFFTALWMTEREALAPVPNCPVVTWNHLIKGSTGRSGSGFKDRCGSELQRVLHSTSAVSMKAGLKPSIKKKRSLPAGALANLRISASLTTQVWVWLHFKHRIHGGSVQRGRERAQSQRLNRDASHVGASAADGTDRAVFSMVRKWGKILF